MRDGIAAMHLFVVPTVFVPDGLLEYRSRNRKAKRWNPDFALATLLASPPLVIEVLERLSIAYRWAGRHGIGSNARHAVAARPEPLVARPR